MHLEQGATIGITDGDEMRTRAVLCVTLRAASSEDCTGRNCRLSEGADTNDLSAADAWESH